MKEGRDPLAANQTTNECTVFREFIANGLRNFKYELNHTDSEEKISTLLFEREVYLKQLSARVKQPKKSLEHGTNRLSRNIGKQISTYAAY
jgi:hypothetical protein